MMMMMMMMMMTNGYREQLNVKTGEKNAREKYVETKLDKLLTHTDRIADCLILCDNICVFFHSFILHSHYHFLI
jgi:hypothetical protein